MKNVLFCLISFCVVFFSAPLQAAKVETNVIKYVTLNDGAIMHVGIWNDCVISTVIANAPDIGSQMIVLNNDIVYDHSTNFSERKDHFIHQYSWGRVISWNHKQAIERN